MPEYITMVGELPYVIAKAGSGDVYFFVVLLRVFIALNLTLLLVAEAVISLRYRVLEKATRVQRKTILYTFIMVLFTLHAVEFALR